MAVGRLVETAGEATALIDAYLSTPAGVVTPHAAFVSGYGFLEDGAQAVAAELKAGLAPADPVDTLIDPSSRPPSDPASWTADMLRAQLLGRRYDLVYLAGHFSAATALAADYKTRLLTADIELSPLDLRNVIFYSTGCHSGYNTVNADGVPNLTPQPDWAQALARKGATLIGGTGYQYGDAELMEYAERLYLGFTQQLRRPGAISVGQALVRAKQAYLADTGVEFDGVFEKSLLVSALFGLPMLRVEMPGQPSAEAVLPPIVTATQPVTSGPGASYGLLLADVTVAPVVTTTERTLTSALDPGTTYQATALQGKDGVVARPGQPLLPLAVYNLNAPGGLAGGVLRGVGLRGARYTDRTPIFPLTGAPATEIAGVRPVFRSMNFYPSKPWTVNYFANLTDAVGGVTRLMLTPAQYQSSAPDSLTGVLRTFASMDFRLYYSRESSPAALAAPPALAQVAAADLGGGNHLFRVYASIPWLACRRSGSPTRASPARLPVVGSLWICSKTAASRRFGPACCPWARSLPAACATSCRL